MKYKAIINNKIDIELEIEAGAGTETPRLKIGQTEKDVRLVPLAGGVYQLIYGGEVYLAHVAKSEHGYAVRIDDHVIDVGLVDEKMLMIERLGIKTVKKKASGTVKSPMPGLVVKLNVSVGDKVTVGEGILVLEAMKMMNEIKSTVSGTVKEIFVSELQPVEKNQLLLKIE
jgi:biotin carboxyl carrier protein